MRLPGYPTKETSLHIAYAMVTNAGDTDEGILSSGWNVSRRCKVLCD